MASADHNHLLASFAGGVDIHDGREAHELTAGVQLAYALAFTMTENEGAPAQGLSESLVLLQREIAGLVLVLAPVHQIRRVEEEQSAPPLRARPDHLEGVPLATLHSHAPVFHYGVTDRVHPQAVDPVFDQRAAAAQHAEEGALHTQ